MKKPTRCIGNGVRCVLMGVGLLFLVAADDGGCGSSGGTTDSKTLVVFNFGSECAKDEVKLYLNNELRDTFYIGDPKEYEVEPGTYTYVIRFASNGLEFHKGEFSLNKGVRQPLTITCSNQ